MSDAETSSSQIFFLFSKSDVGVMEPYNDDRWNHDLFESHKPARATHCFQTKAKSSAWEQDETNYAGVEATPLPPPPTCYSLIPIGGA